MLPQKLLACPPINYLSYVSGRILWMKRNYRLLLVFLCCASFSPAIACSGVHSTGQPSPAASAQPGQPLIASTTPALKEGEQSGGLIKSAGVIVDELHTPVKGSDERQAIMDGLREEFNNRRGSYYQPHHGNIVFVVDRLRVHEGWAWTFANPKSSDPADQFGEYNGFLLHLQDGRWAVTKLPEMVNNPDDPENLDYPTAADIARIKRMYPNVPTDIFSK